MMVKSGSGSSLVVIVKKLTGTESTKSTVTCTGHGVNS